MEMHFFQLRESTKDKMGYILENPHRFEQLWIQKGQKFWLQNVISLRDWFLQHENATPETMDYFFIRILKVLTSESFDKVLEWVQSLNLIFDSKWFLPDAQAFLNTRVQGSVPQCTAAFVHVFGFLPNVSHSHDYLRKELSLSLKIVSAFSFLESNPGICSSWVPPESWMHPVVYVQNFNSYIRATWGTTLLHLLEVEVEDISWWKAPVLPLTGHLAENLVLLFQNSKLPLAHQKYFESQPVNDTSNCTTNILPEETDASSFLECSMLESHTVPSNKALDLDFTHEDSNQNTENKLMTDIFTTTYDYSIPKTHTNASSRQLNLIHSRKRTLSGQPVTNTASGEHIKLELHVVLEKYLSLKSGESDCYKLSGPRNKFLKVDDDYESQSYTSSQDHEENEYCAADSATVTATESEEYEVLINEDKDFEPLCTNPIQKDYKEDNCFTAKDVEEIESLFASFPSEDSEFYYSESEDYEDSIQDNNAHHVSSVTYTSEDDECYESSPSSPVKVEDETYLFMSTPPSSILANDYLPLTPPSSNQHSEDEKDCNIFTSTPYASHKKNPFFNCLKSEKFHFESSVDETTNYLDLSPITSLCQAMSKQQANKPIVEKSTKKLMTRRARNELQAKRGKISTSPFEAVASVINPTTMCGATSEISKQVVRPNKRKCSDRE